MIDIYELDDNSIEQYRKYIKEKDMSVPGIMIDLFVYGIDDDDERVGVLWAEFSSKNCVIKSIYVDEDYDNIRTYVETITALAYVAFSRGCRTISTKLIPGRAPQLYGALCSFEPQKQLEEVGYLEFELGDVVDLPRLKTYSKSTHALSHCFQKELNQFVNRRLDTRLYDTDISSAYFENDKIAAMLLVEKYEDNTFGITKLVSRAKDKTAILSLMAFSIKKATEKYGKNTIFKMVIANERLTPILEIVLNKEIERREDITINLDFIEV